MLRDENQDMALLEARGLTKNFGGLAAVLGVDLDVKEREILGMIGPNGAGKTTVFNLITGIYPPTAGTIRFNGHSLVGLRPHCITELGIARTFQTIRLFPNLTASENVMAGLHCRTREYRDELARNLPYGSQRRLEIARGLATHPRLLILDEPAAGLNEQESAELMALIHEIRDSGITILLIEHDMRVVMGISDRIVVLDNGEKIAEGAPNQIQSNARVIEAYLGKEED
jgi:branched-chain amino acid transport system ATP-binding protein